MGALLVQAGDGYSRAELMREADRLMYAAKHDGKNRVTIGLMPAATTQDTQPRAPFLPETAVAVA